MGAIKGMFGGAKPMQFPASSGPLQTVSAGQAGIAGMPLSESTLTRAAGISPQELAATGRPEQSTLGSAATTGLDALSNIFAQRAQQQAQQPGTPGQILGRGGAEGPVSDYGAASRPLAEALANLRSRQRGQMMQ